MKLALIGEGALSDVVILYAVLCFVHGRWFTFFVCSSCAWRHCGAQADAQEALAELYNLLGVLEPFECLFCLDIVERSLHDVLAVSTSEKNIPVYIPYQPRGQEDGNSALDMDFIEALNGLRNQY